MKPSRGAPRRPYLGLLVFPDRKREAQRGKAFSCDFCIWLTLSEAGAGVLLFVFPLFNARMMDDPWRCQRPVLWGWHATRPATLTHTCSRQQCSLPCGFGTSPGLPGPSRVLWPPSPPPGLAPRSPGESMAPPGCGGLRIHSLPGPRSQRPCLDRKMCVIGLKDQALAPAGVRRSLEHRGQGYGRPRGAQAGVRRGVCGAAGGGMGGAQETGGGAGDWRRSSREMRGGRVERGPDCREIFTLFTERGLGASVCTLSISGDRKSVV